MCPCVVMAVVIYQPCTIRPCLCLLRLGLLGTGNVSHSLAVPVGPTAAAGTWELGAAWESAVRRQGTAVASGPSSVWPRPALRLSPGFDSVPSSPRWWHQELVLKVVSES